MRKGLAIMLITIFGSLVLLGLALFIASDNYAQFGASPSGERLERIMSSPNFNGQKFVNSLPSSIGNPGHFWEAVNKIFFGPELRSPEMELPVVPIDSAAFASQPPSGLRITWLGHSTVLVEMDGLRILTDPVWSKRASPFVFPGPARFFDVPIAITDLPALDAVVISHDHYDHLDKNAVVSLAKTGVNFILPLGVGAHLEKWGIAAEQISELDWWESWTDHTNRLQITATPARHFSGRGPLTGNHTLWASWVFAGLLKRVYFSGDTGPFPGFEEIGTRYGPFDITLVKIGAYNKGWPDIHLNPDQALDAHLALRGRLLQPIHWGTFNLAFHDWYEPAVWLLREARERNIPIVIPRPGEQVDPVAPPEVQEWWLPDVREPAE
ncbi:MBL fold metallo-hydrolase [Candidatus Neomarinimicrobiota bacterium]